VLFKDGSVLGVVTGGDVDTGSLSWQLLLALLLVTSAGVYWRHKRQPIPVRNNLRRDARSRNHGIVQNDQ